MAPILKRIVVYGATGAQGGAVVRSLLESTTGFSVRAVTRNPESSSAKELIELGAEVVKADGFDDEEMRQALKGAWGFWLNTNHQDPVFTSSDQMNDTKFGCRLISLALEAEVKVIIYSTCNSSTQYSHGKAVVEGMDEKNKVFQYAVSQQGFDAVVGVIPGWYMENFLSPQYAACFGGFPCQPDAEGYLTFSSPRLGGAEQVPWISIDDDFGDMIHGLFLDPKPYHGKTVQCFSDSVTFDGLTKLFTDATGQKARYMAQASPKDFPTHGIGALEEIQDIFAFTQYTNGNFFGVPNDIGTGKALKKSAVEAKGKKDADTITIGDYFHKHFT